MVLELVTGVKGYLWDIILPLLLCGTGIYFTIRLDDEHRERCGKHLTKSPLKGFLNIVNRTAGDMTVYVGLVFLGQGCLSIDRRHSKKCRKPHPEDRARSARNDCTRRTRDIPGADLRCNRCDDEVKNLTD